MSEENIIYRLEQAERHIAKTDECMELLKRRFEQRERERSEQEKKNLLWGIMLLGSLVTTLIAVLWSYRGVIFK